MVVRAKNRANIGKIVRCLRLAEGCPIERLLISDFDHGPTWIVEPAMIHSNGRSMPYVADMKLRPLRDSDGEDEVLRLVGRPVGDPQAA